jgi:hexosaminidase
VQSLIWVWPYTDLSLPLYALGTTTTSWYLDNTATDWAHVYRQEPCCGVPDHLCPGILGGHGEMWGETVDASDLEQTVWPRLAAVAERLWAPRAVNDTADAHQRIREFRCLLLRRGIAAAPVDNKVARSAPPGPGSCLSQ